MRYMTFSRAFIMSIVFFFGSWTNIFAQLTGIKLIALSGGDYTSIANAITALNASGVGAGGVIFNVGPPSAVQYTETITATLSITATGTAANTIIFRKNPASTAVNPLITAYTTGANTTSSTTQDGIWRFIGVNYVTIDGINLTDPNTTNPATMEYGFALYKASVTAGCQFISIKNCTITLNRVNINAGTAPASNGSTGILVTNALFNSATTNVTPTSAAGTNSNNVFYSNTIQNCNIGITLNGYAASSPFTLADVNNDIGGSSATTANTIVNYGGGAAAVATAAAVNTLNEYTINISYNNINNNNGGGVNHITTLRGILLGNATSANATVNNNTITLKGGGTIQVNAGIENTAGSTAASNTVTINNNTITNSTYTTSTTGSFCGILNSGTPATLNMNGNSVTNNTNSTTSTGFLYGINNNGAPNTVNMNTNVITGNVISGATSGVFNGVFNSATGAAGIVSMNSNTVSNNTSSTTARSAGVINANTVATLNITGNTIANNTLTSTTGTFVPIYNSGAVTGNITITNNNIGTAVTPSVNFTSATANSAAQAFISNTSGATTAALAITGNNIYNYSYTISGTGNNTLISNSATTLSQNISSNIFYNITANTTANVTFIANGVTLSATGTQNINSNAISGTFNKTTVGGTITLYSSNVTSPAGAVINQNNNNFSAITVTGATALVGWAYTDAGSPTYTAQNNVFNNWTGGTSAVTAMNVNITGNGNSITGNQISNLSATAAVIGITSSAGSNNIFSNTISSLNSSAAVATTAISITGGTTQLVYKNKIYDINNSNAGGTVNGILVGAGTTCNIYNNIIGDLKTPAASAVDVIRGISITSTAVTSTINVYYNTIYINATSSGTNFGTTGIFHTANATTTTATLNLRNNSFTNTSTAKGTGLTVAYRRSSNTLGNYASTSNNNHFYSGTPSATNLIFTDGTTPEQTLANYKALATLSPRDQASLTEDLSTKFLSVIGSSASFLHVNNLQATVIKGAAVNISGFTDDFDSQVRAGNTGYTGSGTNPDIGADEILYTNGWIGVTSTDWNVSTNWNGGVPAADGDVDIPTGKTNYPVLTTGNYPVNNINVRSGGSLTLTGGTLQIGGGIATGGTFTASAGGTIEMNGTIAQTIPAAAFAANTINNLKVNNGVGVTLGGTLNVTGILSQTLGTLTTGGFLTLISSATQTALIDASGAGSISGNVTMQRYLASAYGYKYVSSPMQAATVSSFSTLVDLAATFSNFYTYIENNTTSGFTAYTTGTNVLAPLKGYAADFGVSGTPATISITGAVNNGTLSAAISNTNQTYTQGFNLVGNPYPSPIDWNAATGWTKTNLDNAIYYFDSGTTTQYTGSYSTYINGVSSDGIANNILASMQGFFVHVSNGTFPVAGTLGVTNAVRVNNLSPVFHKSTGLSTASIPRTLIRLSASFSGDERSSDPIVVYSDTASHAIFNNKLDAIKLLNTNDLVPNFYILNKQGVKLAIASYAVIDTALSIPLSLHIATAGIINFNLLAADNLPTGINVYLYDSKTNISSILAVGEKISVTLASGDYDGRFYLRFKPGKEIRTGQDVYYLYRKDGKVFVNINLQNDQGGNLSLINISGNVLTKQVITGNGIYNLGSPKVFGIYIVSFVTAGGIHTKKIFVPE